MTTLILDELAPSRSAPKSAGSGVALNRQLRIPSRDPWRVTGVSSRDEAPSQAYATRRAKTRPLSLELANERINVDSPQAFAFALSARSEPASEMLIELLSSADQRLIQALGQHMEHETRLAPVLTRCFLEPMLISEHLLELSLGAFDTANGWRDLFEVLIHLSPRENEYKRIALVKYAQFLRKKQLMLKTVFELRLRRQSLNDQHTAAGTHEPPPGDCYLFDDKSWQQPGRARPACERRLPIRGAQRQGARTLGHAHSLITLPRGEPVELKIGRGRCANLYLGGNRFRLLAGERYYLIDEFGTVQAIEPAVGSGLAASGESEPASASVPAAFPTNRLAPGRDSSKALVGRHSSCDVVLAAKMRSISRRHLLIEPIDPTSVRLTDLSSHGTAVPEELICN